MMKTTFVIYFCAFAGLFEGAIWTLLVQGFLGRLRASKETVKLIGLILGGFIGLCQVTHSFQRMDPALTALTRLKSETTSTVQRLTRLENSASFDLKLKLSNIKISQMGNVNSAVNKAISDIKVDKAKAEGHGDAGQCYDNAKASLRSTSLKAFSELDDCQKTSLGSMDPVVSLIQNAISAGNQLAFNIDSASLSCISPSSSCIGKLPGISAAVNNLKTTSDNLQDTVNRVTNSAVISAMGCMNQAMSSVYSDVGSVRLAANRCTSAS